MKRFRVRFVTLILTLMPGIIFAGVEPSPFIGDINETIKFVIEKLVELQDSRPALPEESLEQIDKCISLIKTLEVDPKDPNYGTTVRALNVMARTSLVLLDMKADYPLPLNRPILPQKQSAVASLE